MIKVTQLDLKEVLVLEYDFKEDNRGTSNKIFSKKELEEVGIFTKFVEEILYCPVKKERYMEFIIKIILKLKQNYYFVQKDEA